MENRRVFLKQLFPRIIGVTATLSVGMGIGHTATLFSKTGIKLNNTLYKSLLDELSRKYHFNRNQLKQLFSQVVLQEATLEKPIRPTTQPPPPPKPYYQYKNLFITPSVIDTGRAYLKENLIMLSQIEEEYHVEKEIICGILGIETRFGEPGLEKHRCFDVLNTAFAHNRRRRAFYRAELIAYLLLCREEGIDPLTIKSSYAGAMGVPQFMPSSVRKYGVDHDKDGRRDLWNSKADIFASVANYFKSFGWQYGASIYLPVDSPKDSPELREIAEQRIRKTVPYKRVAQMGVRAELSPDEPVSLTFYEPTEGTTALLILLNNFRVITRYNFSTHYALAVSDLTKILADSATPLS